MMVPIRSLVAGVLLALGANAASAVPLGTGFTYQGQLIQSGSPVSGTAHFRFSLWDALAGGAQVGASQIVPNVLVTGGIFTVELNGSSQFGANPFNGDARWLQVEVCTSAGCGSTTVLSPRQKLTGAPYALEATQSQRLVNTAGGVGISIGPGGANNSPGMLTGHVPSDLLLGGFLDPATTYGHGFISMGYTTGPRKFSIGRGSTNDMSVATFEPQLTVVSNTGNVGIGTPSPSTALHVRATAPVMILQDDASAANQAGYVGFWNDSSVETGWVGFGNSGDPDLSMVNSRSSGDVVLSPGAGGQVVMNGNAKVGPTGQYFVASGDENLRIIRGTIFGNGNVQYGSGFTVANDTPAPGRFTITFNVPFSSPPSVVATPNTCAGCFVTISQVESVSATQVVISAVHRHDGSYASSAGPVHFIATGPR